MNIVFITLLYPSDKSQSLTDVPYVLHYLVKRWIKENHNVTVFKIETTYPKFLPIYSKKNKERTERLTQIDDVPVYNLPIKKNLNKRFSSTSLETSSKSALDHILKSNIACDVVVVHGLDPSYYVGNFIKQFFDVPLIAGIHTTDRIWINKKKNQKIFEKHKDNIDGYAFRSHSLEKSFKKFIDEEDKRFVIASGIDSKLVLTIKELENKKTRKSSRFVVVSNLIKRKNVDLVLKAFEKIKHTDPLVTLTIIGDGKEKEKLKKLIMHLNLENSVNLVGSKSREDVFKYLEESDVFVLPSVNETFGIVYMEAMAKGCIPIGTINEGIDGIIKNGENGYLCKPALESVFECMSEAISLKDKEKSNLLENVHHTALTYSEENCAENYMKNLAGFL